METEEIEQLRDHADSLAQQWHVPTADTEGTDPDEEVRVRVNATGELVSVHLDESCDDLAADEVGPRILAAYMNAVARRVDMASQDVVTPGSGEPEPTPRPMTYVEQPEPPKVTAYEIDDVLDRLTTFLDDFNDSIDEAADNLEAAQEEPSEATDEGVDVVVAGDGSLREVRLDEDWWEEASLDEVETAIVAAFQRARETRDARVEDATESSRMFKLAALASDRQGFMEYLGISR